MRLTNEYILCILGITFIAIIYLFIVTALHRKDHFIHVYAIRGTGVALLIIVLFKSDAWVSLFGERKAGDLLVTYLKVTVCAVIGIILMSNGSPKKMKNANSIDWLDISFFLIYISFYILLVIKCFSYL
jgi:hypothetical protein